MTSYDRRPDETRAQYLARKISEAQETVSRAVLLAWAAALAAVVILVLLTVRQ